jgi:DNA helicase-2/ATP-dependent DNA helicase PcrA
LLREEGKTFDILTGKEQLILMRKLIKRHRIKDVSTGMALKEISLAKSNLISCEEFLELFDTDQTMAKVGKIYGVYEAEKKKRMCFDFDDFLCETYKLLNDNAKVRRKYQDYYHHLMVDEYQDVTPAQIEVLKLLLSRRMEKGKGSFCIYGDDWQSIFSFCGSSVGNLLNFERIFAGANIFILSQNYRSTPQILAACQNLISHNERKIEKILETQNPDGDDVVVIEASSAEDEAVHLVNEITDLVERKEGYQYKDIAVLYRANFQSRTVEEYLADYEIPYHIENGLNFYQRYEVKVLLDYMRLIIDPDSDDGDEALKCMINIPNRYIGRAFVNELEEHAFQKKKHLYKALKSFRIDIPYLKKNVKQFIKLMDPLIKDAEDFEPAELIDILRDALDYDRFICDDETPNPDDSRITNIEELKLAAARYTDIPSFLHYTETFRDEVANDKEGVSLMTIHKSKGLEFPVVFLVGLVEGIIPTKKGDIEEERRICFVGISRAMRLLYLSYYQTMGERFVTRSIFVDEILGNE